MFIYDEPDPKNLIQKPVQGYTMDQLGEASFNENVRNKMMGAGLYIADEYRQKNRDFVEKQTGKPFESVLEEYFPDKVEQYKRYRQNNAGGGIAGVEKLLFSKLKQTNPKLWAEILSDEEIQKRIPIDKRTTRENYVEISSSMAPSWSKTGTEFLAGLRAFTYDPMNMGLTIATMGIGAGVGGSAISQIAKSAMVEFGVNAATEAVQIPFVARDLEAAGINMDLSEAVNQVAMVGLIGGVIGGGARAAGIGIDALASRSLGLDAAAEIFESRGKGALADELRVASDAEDIKVRDLSRYTDEITAEQSIQARQAAESMNASGSRVLGEAIDGISDDVVLRIDPTKIEEPSLRAEFESYQKTLRESIEADNSKQEIFGRNSSELDDVEADPVTTRDLDSGVDAAIDDEIARYKKIEKNFGKKSLIKMADAEGGEVLARGLDKKVSTLRSIKEIIQGCRSR